MNKMPAFVVVACAVLACAATIRIAAAQDRTLVPGQPTQGKVWIQNQGETEAVPVSIEAMSGSAQPLRVQLAGSPTVVLGAETILRTRTVAQPWEYQTITIPAGQDPAVTLNAAGANGWEAAGVTLSTQGGTQVVMKRPR